MHHDNCFTKNVQEEKIAGKMVPVEKMKVDRLQRHPRGEKRKQKQSGVLQGIKLFFLLLFLGAAARGGLIHLFNMH